MCSVLSFSQYKRNHLLINKKQNSITSFQITEVWYYCQHCMQYILSPLSKQNGQLFCSICFSTHQLFKPVLKKTIENRKFQLKLNPTKKHTDERRC